MWRHLAIAGTLFLAGCDVGGEAVHTPDRAFRVGAFRSVAVDWQHEWDSARLPVLAAAVIDVENDGSWELFLGGGEGQDDVFLRYQDGQMRPTAYGSEVSSRVASYAATASDIDNDGLTDLIVSRADGVVLYFNRTEAGKVRFDTLLLRGFSLPANRLVLGIAPADYDRDGDTDLYLSTYPTPDAAQEFGTAPQNILLKNMSDFMFADVTQEANASSPFATLASLWADFDQDGQLDILTASQAGKPLLLQNKGGKFAAHELPVGDGFWSSLTLGDIDSDGDADVFLSNIGITRPDFLLDDLREEQTLQRDWVLLRNQGKMQFSDVSKIYGVGGYGVGRGAVMDDLNLDGRLDLLVAQNDITWFPHRFRKLAGKVLLNLEGYHPALRQVDILGLNNEAYGQTPILMDINNDALQDVVWINVDARPRAFINRSQENFLLLRLPDSVRQIGTSVTLGYEDGRSFTHILTNNIGLLGDQSPEVSFGLGGRGSVAQAVVDWGDGRRTIIPNPAINQRLVVAPE